MKRITLLAIPPLLFCLVAASCPPPSPEQPKDPYRTARFTITIVKTTVLTAKLGFDGVALAVKQDCTVKLCAKRHPDTTVQQYQDCLLQDHSKDAEYLKCDRISLVAPYVVAGTDIMLQGCATATEAVQLTADLAAVRNDKKLKSACAGGDQKACDEHDKRVEAICAKVDPTKSDQYKLCIVGKPVAKADWSGVLKKSACIAHASFVLIPSNPKYDVYISAVRLWLKSYGGCP